MALKCKDGSWPCSGPVLLTAALGAGATALAAVLLLWRRTEGQDGAALARLDATEREKLLAILAELSRRFFHVCQDVASISKTVRGKLEVQTVDITDEKLREQLSRQCKVFERLTEIQTEVSGQFDCTPEAVQEMQQRATQDAKVQAYAEGFRTMLDDALGGSLPVLPSFSVPEGLTEERVLQIMAEVHKVELKKILEAAGGTKCTMKKLGEVMTLAQKQAWEESLEGHKELVRGGPENFHSAVAIFMRNEDFAKERKKLDEAHQKKLLKLFAPESLTQVKP